MLYAEGQYNYEVKKSYNIPSFWLQYIPAYVYCQQKKTYINQIFCLLNILNP